MSPLLVESARLHSQDMIAENYFSHFTPAGIGPDQRIQATGFAATGYAESIETDTTSVSAGSPFPANYAAWDTGYSLSNLIVDNGTPDLGHRVMLLDIGGQFVSMRQVGIGIASQVTTSGGMATDLTDTTIDLASTRNTKPFLTGAVFNDTAGNGEYEPGEGLGGVTITVSNVGATTTLDAGGYSIQLPAGVYTVTASGGGLPAPIVRTVVVQNNNVQLDFDEDPNGATLAASAAGSVSGELGSFARFDSADQASSYSARIDWGNGNDSVATLTPNDQGGFTVSGSNTYTRPGVYAVRVLVTHLSDGQTLALNAAVTVGGDPGAGSGSTGGGTSGTGAGSLGSAGSNHKRENRHPKPKAKGERPHPKPKDNKSKLRPVQGAKKSHGPHKTRDVERHPSARGSRHSI
jgi:hypothetical protein